MSLAFADKNMPISSITQVLLRLAALNWFIGSITQTAFSIFSYRSSSFSLLAFASPIILLLFSVLCWFLAPSLSRLFSAQNDRNITLNGINLRNLYATAFVGLGLYFALGNFARVFSWAHYYIIYKSGKPEYAVPGTDSFYNLSEPIMTFFAGIVLVATADIWARKLTKKSNSEQGAAANP